MITVKEFRNIINQCPKDWTITFQKWEHGTQEEFTQRNHYPAPNLISIKIQSVETRRNDMGGIIAKFIFEDDFDDDFTMTPDEILDYFCNDLDDYDLLDFVLYTEDTPGHYNHVRLNVSAGDKGYSDRNMKIDLDEV